MKKRIFVYLLLFFSTSVAVKAQKAQIIDEKVATLLSKMTLEEKIDYIGGYNTFYIRPIERLGIPEIRMADGPQGVRNDASAQLTDRDKKSTLYPCGMAAAATWDRTLVQKMGTGIGQDARARGIHILLGPGVNIYRSPLCGRNFEYFGEDPYLVSETAVNIVKGIQSQGVMACIKHYAANNQEWDRHNTSSDVDERTMHEIYLPAFEKCVKQANIGAIMCGYHLVNSVHTSENYYLNIEVLRNQWGFKGILMSDWGGTYSTLGAVYHGLDIEMPGGGMMNRAKMMSLVKNGVIDKSVIDLKVKHILQSLITFGFFDRPQLNKQINERNPYSEKIALEIARNGVVMLKNNNNTLPLSKGKVVVCGPNANTITTGGGSGVVYPFTSCSIAEGIKQLGHNIQSLYDTSKWNFNLSAFYADASCTIQGVKVEYFNNKNLSGSPIHTTIKNEINNEYADSPVPGIVTDDYSDRYTFYYKPQSDSFLFLSAGGDDGYRLLINDKVVIDDWDNHAYRSKDICRHFEAGHIYKLTYEHTDDYSISKVMFRFSNYMDDPVFKRSLKKADAIVVCLGFDAVSETEGTDRSFTLPEGQINFLDAILKHNQNVIVVLNAGGGIEMTSWINRVQTVLMAWYPGQEGGKAIAEIITGKISPSGKLPFTIEKQLEDNPTYNNYHTNTDMHIFNSPYRRVAYNEGIFVGYRGYEQSGTIPLFEFGFGLSYSHFTYSNIQTQSTDKGFIISFDVKNTGKYDAAEIAQLYIRDVITSVPRPPKELKGYEKIFLKKGETRRIKICLNEESFRFYNYKQHHFTIEPGEFDILIGSSSQDIRLTTRITIHSSNIKLKKHE